MDHKREHRTPPLARVMGVGSQQHPIGLMALLARWKEKLVGGPQAGRSESLERVKGVSRQQHKSKGISYKINRHPINEVTTLDNSRYNQITM